MSNILSKTISSKRWSRGGTSEIYGIYITNRLVAHVHVTYTKYANAIVLLMEKFNESDHDEIAAYIYSLIDDEELEDTMMVTYETKERSVYSKRYDWDSSPISREDFKKLEAQIATHSGKHQRVLGQLNEAIVKEYWEEKGYRAHPYSDADDANKVDLVVENDELLVLCQIKAGQISYKEIVSCLRKMVARETQTGKRLVYAFFAKQFPKDMEIRRLELHGAFGPNLIFVTSLELASVMPKYKHALS